MKFISKLINQILEPYFRPQSGMNITLGVGSYHGLIIPYFEPELIIGNYTSLGSNLIVHGASNHKIIANQKMVTTYPFGKKGDIDESMRQSKGPIKIGSDVWIGNNVTILSGVTIGDGVIIGTCSVIAKDIPPYAVAAGNPATIIRYRYPIIQIKKMKQIAWWYWPKTKIIKNLLYFENIDLFIQKFCPKK